MKNLYTLTILLFLNNSFAQNVGIGTTTPDANAMLDITSTNKGLLLTRLPLVTIDVPNPLTIDVEGMITYNTTIAPTITATSVTEGMYYNDGVNWNFMGPNTTEIGDMKPSLETADNNGWYLLDGRTKASLPTVAQANATAVGIGTNLPDAADKFLKAKTGAELIGSSAGSNSVTLVQANLPNINFTGTTNSTGAHTHTYTDTYNASKTLGLATNIIGLLPIISTDVGTNDTIPGNLFATASNGNHTHTVTVPSGGSGTVIAATPLHLVTNVFIYLGE
ncbi:MAG: hypothetical protein V4548_02680 [Bacteroidota bacterium]